MIKELKIHIYNVKHLEEKLLKKDAKFIEETYFIDTYFNQPLGKVLKIVEKNKGAFVNIFQAINGKFDVVEDEQIDNPEELKKKYTTEHGIKRVMKGTRKFFQFQNYKITFNLIDDVGDFLIVTGENPSKAFVEKELGIKNPEYITVSFDEVKP